MELWTRRRESVGMFGGKPACVMSAITALQLRRGNREDGVIGPHSPLSYRGLLQADRDVPAGTVVAVTPLNRLTSFERRCTR